MTKLEEINEKMKSLKASNDPEMVHGRADTLLEETIKFLSINHNEADVILEILKTYENLDKLYA